jgi:hypothetical protein
MTERILDDGLVTLGAFLDGETVCDKPPLSPCVRQLKNMEWNKVW